MKYKYLIDMPSAIENWLENELEARGIDAVVYSRYIFSLLQEDCLDDPFEVISGLGITPNKKKECVQEKKRGRKRWRRGFVATDRDTLKRLAVVQCLMSATDEKCGIEKLVDELCLKLKDIESQNVVVETTNQPPTPLIAMLDQYDTAFPPLGSSRSSNTSVQRQVECERKAEEELISRLDNIKTLWNTELDSHLLQPASIWSDWGLHKPWSDCPSTKLGFFSNTSGFVEVIPRNEPRPPPIVNTECAVSKPIEIPHVEEEDLLTSAKTHFRPIRAEENRSYADGTTFLIPSELEKVEFRRSESGTLYLESDAELDMYMEFREWRIEPTNSGNSSPTDEFVPKFRVRQSNEKCIQTEELELTVDIDGHNNNNNEEESEGCRLDACRHCADEARSQLRQELCLDGEQLLSDLSCVEQQYLHDETDHEDLFEHCDLLWFSGHDSVWCDDVTDAAGAWPSDTTQLRFVAEQKATKDRKRRHSASQKTCKRAHCLEDVACLANLLLRPLTL